VSPEIAAAVCDAHPAVATTCAKDSLASQLDGLHSMLHPAACRASMQRSEAGWCLDVCADSEEMYRNAQHIVLCATWASRLFKRVLIALPQALRSCKVQLKLHNECAGSTDVLRSAVALARGLQAHQGLECSRIAVVSPASARVDQAFDANPAWRAQLAQLLSSASSTLRLIDISIGVLASWGQFMSMSSVACYRLPHSCSA
jgi:hypothetical protein